MPIRNPASRRGLARAFVAAMILVATVGCSTSSGTAGGSGDRAATPSPASTVRLGYFANVTHATALVGVRNGFFAKELGATKLETQVFNAGPAAVEAIFAGAVDAAFIGPSPAINAFVKSKGEAVRIVAGAASGGASLVVRPEIGSPADLRGKMLASPQLGNTQDVALRHWLREQGYRISPQGVGDVKVAPSDSATTLQLFRDGRIDGAWVPEPWASRLVLEGGGKVLVDERDLWPDKEFVTTHLLVSTKFLRQHPQTVSALLRGELSADAWLAADPDRAQTAVNAEIEKLTGKALPPAVVERAFANITITVDPLAASLATSAEHATAVGLLRDADLRGIYDLRLLNDLLRAEGKQPVDDAGLAAKG